MSALFNTGEVESDYWRKDMLDDLQLAAELGKTLLDRNKQLEDSLKHHQTIIEDQRQEIEYLTKQTVALREVNDSRLRIYEQLEVSIHELERSNHRLKVDQQSDKKSIKSLTQTIQQLETKCDELQGNVDELTKQLEVANAKNRKENGSNLHSTTSTPHKPRPDFAPDLLDFPTHPFSSLSNDKSPNTSFDNENSTKNQQKINSPKEDPQIAILEQNLKDLELQNLAEKRRVLELEDQLASLVQDNRKLEDRLASMNLNETEMKSMHEEFGSLDEVRQGILCSRCLRSCDSISTRDDLSILDPEEEIDDDDSMLEALGTPARYHSSVSLQILQDEKPSTQNLYRDLVEKYEKLIAVNRQKPTLPNQQNQPNQQPLSLQEELQMSGEYNLNQNQNRCDFSEAETSSSGFADETSNKSTQTENLRPGSFLCAIKDGDDCQLSIYDDKAPLDSRFRDQPEYREIFKEIFGVLKKSALTVENEDEIKEQNVDGDVTIESLNASLSDHEPVTVVENIEKTKRQRRRRDRKVANQRDSTPAKSPTPPEPNLTPSEPNQTPSEPTLTPLKRDPLEYISVSVNVKKRNSSKKRQRQILNSSERSDSPIIPLSPQINYIKNKNKRSPKSFNTAQNYGANSDLPSLSRPSYVDQWNGATLQFWNRSNCASPTPSVGSNKSFKNVEFKPSMASHDLNKLKKLDLSYAEVLRSGSPNQKQIFNQNYRNSRRSK